MEDTCSQIEALRAHARVISAHACLLREIESCRINQPRKTRADAASWTGQLLPSQHAVEGGGPGPRSRFQVCNRGLSPWLSRLTCRCRLMCIDGKMPPTAFALIQPDQALSGCTRPVSRPKAIRQCSAPSLYVSDSGCSAAAQAVGL